MADEFERRFSSAKEEIEHWKSLCKSYSESAEACKLELEEFQASSHELEAELETQLEAAENRNKELVAANSRLTMEVEGLREKLDSQHASTHHAMSELETKLAKTEAFSAAMQKYIREIEQANDDLERAKRAAVVSLEDFEIRLNQAIERNAFLESELDEKETLAECVQRLKDEARDLRQELAVRRLKRSSVGDDEPGSPSGMPEFPVESPTKPDSSAVVAVDMSSTVSTSQAGLATPSHARTSAQRMFTSTMSDGASGQLPSTPITPAARISALNIVGDLLRKLGALESKLATCQTIDRGQLSSHRNFTLPSQSTPSCKRPTQISGSATASMPTTAPSGVQKGHVQIAAV